MTLRETGLIRFGKVTVEDRENLVKTTVKLHQKKAAIASMTKEGYSGLSRKVRVGKWLY